MCSNRQLASLNAGGCGAGRSVFCEAKSVSDDYDEEHVDACVQDVAARLPFPVELTADMGGPSMLQIDLGRRGGVDDPPDSASIDPSMEPVVWILDVEGGRETISSEFGLDADPQRVADWITEEARRAGSPAALHST